MNAPGRYRIVYLVKIKIKQGHHHIQNAPPHFNDVPCPACRMYINVSTEVDEQDPYQVTIYSRPADAILDFVIKGHFKVHSGKERPWGDVRYNLPRHRLARKTRHCQQRPSNLA